MLKLTLLIELPNGERQIITLEEFHMLTALNGAIYTLVEEGTQQVPQELVLKRKGDVLEVEVATEIVAKIEGFYSKSMSATFSLDGSFIPAEDLSVSSVGMPVITEGSEVIVWSAQNNDNFLGTSAFVWGAGTLGAAVIGAAVKEVDARLSALRAKATRLRAEILGNKTLVFADDLLRFQEQIKVERALFEQKRTTLSEELNALKIGVDLAREESKLIKELSTSGDVNRTEVIRAARSLNDSEAKLLNRKNTYLEDAGAELAKAEDEIAQNVQILTQRKQQLEDSIFKALVPGIVKNVRVTTIGGVLRAGEELMQIIPVGDELIFEAKVSPADIAQVRKGLNATIRFDPFDYTIYGGVIGEVVYVSADTLKEETGQGEEIYYRVHVSSKTNPVTTTSGKVLDILPGMTAQVDIKTSDRTVLNYLLKPLRKTLAESFGER